MITPVMFQLPSNRSLEEPWHSLFLTAYSLLFIIAFTLNSIMVFSARRKIRGMFFPSDLIDVHLWPFDAVLKDIIQWPQYFIDTINLLPTTYFLYRLFEVVRRTLIVLQSYQHQLTSPDNSVVSNETPELSGYICSAFVG